MRRKRWIVFDVSTDENNRARLVVLDRFHKPAEAVKYAKWYSDRFADPVHVTQIPRRDSIRTNRHPRWIDVVLRRRFCGQPQP